jgi:hypothetical protein
MAPYNSQRGRNIMTNGGNLVMGHKMGLDTRTNSMADCQSLT